MTTKKNNSCIICRKEEGEEYKFVLPLTWEDATVYCKLSVYPICPSCFKNEDNLIFLKKKQGIPIDEIEIQKGESIGKI